MRRVIISLAMWTACLLLCLGLSSCFDDDEVTSLEGTVQFLDIEGGCWRIAGNDGVNYEPINLPEEFKEDGLAVRFKVKYRDDLVSICMVGRIVELLSIRRMPH